MKEMPTKTCAYRALRWTCTNHPDWKHSNGPVSWRSFTNITALKQASCASLILPAIFIMMNMKALILSQKTARK
ncbi:hypothetical protein D9M68_813860 [compost metagenome]